MATKFYPTDVVEQAKVVADAWVQISADLTFGDLNSNRFHETLAEAIALQTQLINLENQLVDLRNRRDDMHVRLWDGLKRLRAGIKAIYGDDSSQFELVGGTRTSERKSPTRRAPTVPTA